MGRSKFPGKPSKHVNRTRVNVLPPLTSTTVGENKLVLNSENEAEDQHKEIGVNDDNESEPSTSQVDTSVSLRTNTLSRAKRKCITARSNSVTKSRLCRENIGIKRNKVSVKNLSEMSLPKRGVRRAVQGFSSLRRLNRSNSLKENSNLVGKFVLPSRSVHSSRVIKPNKRFINVESVNRIEVRSLKKRAVNRRSNVKQNEERKLKTKLGDQSNQVITSNQNSSSMPCANRRIILRQARLQLNNSTPSGTEGPFSSHSSSGSPPGTITCGVCGAVRFYRFIKQARKFNIYSCESCRKFISKIIKRQTCSKNSSISTLVCHKGQGKCHVPPIVRSQQWNLIHCAYRARCPACWLKMCLRSFQMPQNLKNSLYKLLPVNMRRPDTNLFNNSVSLFSWQNSCGNDIKTLNPVDISQNVVKQRPLRIKQPKPEVNSTTIPSSDIKRQKIDLKGPRVKHVCRSASIVLGQPIATFQSEADKNDTEISDSQNKLQIETDSQVFKKDSTSAKTSLGLEKVIEEAKVNDAEQLPVVKSVSSKPETSTTSRKEKSKSTSQTSCNIQLESKMPPITKKSLLEGSTGGICIDFWESYDPEEVCRNGFNLIASEPFPMQSICFLCGSAGREPLLYCSLCCEPYHSFCLEQDPQLLGGSIQYNWLCPRCTTCHACGQPDKQKVNCQKCHKTYHPECFNSKWITDDKPTVCLSCLRCKSCGTNNITKFIGNLPLCVMCFKLRKKGNYCPLCQKCYDDNDFDTKMMECAKCNKWVHAKCEGLSDENYQILSLLPESVEFLCKICSNNTIPYWRKAVESELRTSFNNVLRLLSKNRVAREMLKWSPLCSNIFNTKTASAARKLQFSDDDGEDDSNDHDNFSDKSDKSTSYSETGSFIEDEISKTGQRRKQSQKEIETIPLRMDQVSNRAPHTPSMTDIKNKLNSNEIYSISEFNKKMNEVLNVANSGKLVEIYRSILKTIFPWYDPEMFGIEESSTTVQEEPVVEIPKSENILQMWPKEKLNIKQNFDSEKFDTRSCAFCKGVGDGLSHQEARLLYCGQNEWVHANCALWSSEVYEEIDGSLQNVHSALSRGRSIRCTYCKLKGASIGCCAKGCYETFHFSCARTMKCNFMHDKTVYCPSHDLPVNSTVISSLADFDIRRSVYIELDKKKKKLVDPEKVHTIVGSLTITSLGKIIPVLSDTSDAIIPTGFVCSRLFWSTVEPWKLVPYVITTSVLNSQINSIVVDKNFTVNHSLSKSVVEKKLKEILVWQKDLEKEKIDAVDLEDEDEPQNATDILSPELTDAILEELPRDILDGISMQDIFPKFVSYEEFVNVDFKNPDTQNSNDDIKIDTVNNLNDSFKKNSDIDEKEQLHDDFCDLKNRELKRSKSEVFSQLGVEKVSKSRSQQRSCSLTWSCKLDTSLSPLVKKRKMVPRDKNVFFQLLQVDGAYDSSSASECGSPRRETEDLWSPNICDEPVKCQRCQCTYRTQASYKRHLESCEIMSTSDSDSETVHEQDFNSSEQSIQAVVDTVASITDVTINNDTDVEFKVGEVSRTYGMNSYEEFSAYPLNESNECKNQSTLVAALSSTSNHAEILFPNVLQSTAVQEKSVQNFYTVPTQNFNPIVSTPQTQTSNTSFFDGHQTVSINSNHNSSITQASTIPLNQITTLPLTTQTTPICINQSNTVPLCLNQTAGSISVVQSSPIAVNQPGVISIGQQSIPLNSNPNSIQINPPIEIQPQQVTIQSVPMNQEVNQVLNISQQNPITIDTKMLAASSVVNPGIVPSQWMKTIPKTVPVPKPIRAKCRPRTLAAKRTKIPPGSTIVLPQTNSGPQVIVQHIPSPNMMPTFLETFQHQTGQNLQYVATISPQITQAVNSQPQIVQLQSDNNIVGLVPGLQQPTMIIQQPRVVADQLIIDQNGSVMWASQPVQPVYYGFETIVQNTVMQSQQFLPTTVPGILTANSSYSSTTQVFQTSKLEPILDVSSGSFVVLNPNTVINNGQSLPVAQIPQAPPPQPIQNNIQSQQVSIRPPIPSEIKINIAKPVEVTTQAVPVTTLKSTVTTTTTTITTATNAHSTSNNTYNSITLPVAPFVPEQRIPTNIVTPTPKVSTSNQNRPMSRVLPMQTTSVRDTKKLVNPADKSHEITIKTEQPINISEEILKVKKSIIVEEELIKPKTKEIMIQTVETLNKNEGIPLPIKPTLEKSKEELQQRKVTECTNQKNYSVQIISLKPMKPKTASQSPSLSSISTSILPTKPITAFAETPFTSTKDIRDTAIPKSNVNKQPVVVKSEPKVHNEKVETSSNPGILYTVETRDGFRYSSNSVSDLWSKVFEAVQAARIAHNMAPLPSNGLNLINNLQLLGLKANSLRYLLEQLPGASKCVKYKPNFNFNTVHSSVDDDILIGQSYGAIRCAPYNKRHEINDMFGWLASKHRKLEDHTTLNEIQPSSILFRRSSVTNLPMAMRFRQLRLSSKVSVGVYRSSIHRRGLFCLRDIESGEMVIEYAGEVIRSVLTDKREKHYNSKGIGCYMFRIDDNLVVDATMKGNAARFINHSCDPNCYSKVVEILGHKHIIIFALRKIFCGEELTYDYKFPFEEDKIPCTCGARRCRKFLN